MVMSKCFQVVIIAAAFLTLMISVRDSAEGCDAGSLAALPGSVVNLSLGYPAGVHK